MNEGKRGYREIKHVAAPRKPVKKRNPVAHAAQSVAKGSGTHKDKKRAVKHGDTKHKKSEFAMMEGAQYAHKLDLMLKMAVIEDTLSENKMARGSNPEYDDEAGMARNSLKTMHRAIIGLAKTINQGDNLPEWCQEKLSLAEDYLVTVWDYLQSEKEQGVAEGFNPVESDYGSWYQILEKDGYRNPDVSGAYALELVAGDYRGQDGYVSTIRNILTYVKQNRAVLGKAVAERKTVKDCIMDIKKEYPQLYQAAQQPQGVAEAGYGRNRGYTQGFASPNAPSLVGNNYDSDGNRLGGGHDEYHVPDPVDTNTWYIRANGKIIKDRDGEPFQYRDKSAANKAALTMMTKPFNAGKKFMLTTKAVDKDDT
jgi:hypothetical protein